MTRASIVTCSISSSFGTLPNSFCKATATLAFNRRFFCSLLMLQIQYQNSQSLSSFGTLVLERVLELYLMHKLEDFGVFSEMYRKRTFSVQVSPNCVEGVF